MKAKHKLAFLINAVMNTEWRHRCSYVARANTSPEDLANIDDATPDKEMLAPDENSLSTEEYGRQLVLYKAEQATLDLQIGVSVLSRHIVLGSLLSRHVDTYSKQGY